MITLTGEDISQKQYSDLILYLLKKCEFFTFCLPDFGKLIRVSDGERTAQRLDDGSAFISYKNKVMPEIEKLSTHLVQVYESEIYGLNEYDREREIYVVKIDDSLDASFFDNHSLYDWRYPDFPEDICFYKDGKCFMETVAHEQLCFFYFADEELESFLWEKHIEYWIEDDFQYIPILLKNGSSFRLEFQERLGHHL